MIRPVGFQHTAPDAARQVAAGVVCRWPALLVLDREGVHTHMHRYIYLHTDHVKLLCVKVDEDGNHTLQEI